MQIYCHSKLDPDKLRGRPGGLEGSRWVTSTSQRQAGMVSGVLDYLSQHCFDGAENGVLTYNSDICSLLLTGDDNN